MPTIGTFLQLLPAGFRGKAPRATDGTVYSVVEGRGTADDRRPGASTSDRATSSWCRRGRRCACAARDDAVLFSFSDRPVQQAIGHREAFVDD